MEPDGFNDVIPDNCVVIVSFVRSSTSVLLSSSTHRGMDEQKARKRKRASSPGNEQNLGDFLMYAGRLRRCSQYFDTCLSARWAGARAETSTFESPVHLTLDVHTDVLYYEDCFSRMNSRTLKQIPGVPHCLKLLLVASQISYLALVEDCVRYLTSIPWSVEDEKEIRDFANSEFYPSDLAADLSDRLGLSLSVTERRDLLLDVSADALRICLDKFMWNTVDNKLRYSRDLFESAFRLLVSGPSESLAEAVLKHVLEGVKKIAANEHTLDREQGLWKVRWVLRLLLETGCATDLVEFIVAESGLYDVFISCHLHWREDWLDLVHSVFDEVIEGRLLLKASTRLLLLEGWTGVLLYGSELEGDKSGRIYKTLSTFLTTFSYETQKRFISEWARDGAVRGDVDLHLVKVHAKWFASLQKKVNRLGL